MYKLTYQTARHTGFFALLVALTFVSSSAAQTGKFTFKLDQHETVLNDQATLEKLQALIDMGLADPNDPQVAYELERAELQQMMSNYNAKCTLITSALNLRAHPTISIGNGLELAPGNLDPTTSDQNIIGFRLEIGSTANLYNFGNHTLNNLPAFPMVVPNNTSVSATIQDGGNTLAVNFGNGGLLPGQMSTMQIQLLQQNAGPTTPWPLMTDFFSEDSTLTVIFQDPDTMSVLETNPFPFADFMQHVAMWDDQIDTSSQHIDGVVDSYVIDNGGGTVIPEPGSIVLALASLAGYSLLGRRRRA